MRNFYYGFFLAGMLLASAANAQRVQLGFKGGASIANGIGPDAEDSPLRFGAQGGGLLRVKLTKQIALQAEALYTQRGDNGAAYGRTIAHRLDYLDVPLLLQYHKDDFFLETGAQLSWLRSATPNGIRQTALNALTFRQQEKSFLLGFGYQDSSGVMVGWRYVRGLDNVYEPGAISGSRQIQLRNSSVQFYLGYLFEPRDVVSATVGTGKLLFVTTPTLLFKGGKFLFYTGPTKLVRAVRGSNKPVSPGPAATPEVPSPSPIAPPK